MPLTPLHYPLAHGLSKVGKKLSLPGLVVGAVMPDIEVPLMWSFFSDLPDHLVLHSLIGAATLGTFLAVIVTWLIYPPMISTIFGVDRERLNEVSGLSKMLVVSCLIGVLSHVLLDYPMHWYNPILWPWVDPFAVVGPLVILFSQFGIGTAFRMAHFLTSAIMGVWWLLILVKYWGNDLWENHWVGRSSETQ